MHIGPPGVYVCTYALCAATQLDGHGKLHPPGFIRPPRPPAGKRRKMCKYANPISCCTIAML